MIGNELIFVYGLIALMIILIVTIVIIDKKESKKKPQNLFDTLNMKIINDSTFGLEAEEEPEILEIKEEKKVDFSTFEPVKPVEVVDNTLKDKIDEIEEYIETDLEKTQAQIRVEEITNALKEAKIDEKIEDDKYKKFEEEQEKNAIISYNELKDSYDKLYSENEKVQYLEDDKIPINIEQLYKLQEEQTVDTKKVVLDDLTSMLESPKAREPEPNTFKNSPLLSPVYGIQQPPVSERVTKYVDNEIQSANQFLQNLKELKNNLD